MTSGPVQLPAAGWSALELAALHTAGVTPRRLRQLRTDHPTSAAYRTGRDDGADLDVPALPDAANLPDCLPGDVWVLTIGDGRYPEQLAAAPGAPLLLYGRGDPAALRAGVAVVGTRQMTDLGRIVAGVAVSAAGVLGAPAIAGLARGVDMACAVAALAAPTPAVAVIAAGVNHPTPAEHTDLADRIIAAGGAVISEQPPGYDPSTAARGDRRYAALLQARNRIIAGLATVVVPAEGGVRSGTTGTVWAALGAGRPVVVAAPRPGHEHHPGAQLPLLLADRRARTVEELHGLGMPGPLAREWTGRAPLAAGVGRDRDELATLIGLAHRLSPWHPPKT